MAFESNKKYSVLIIDDEQEIREPIVSFLECMECWQFIIQAADGHQAFIKAQRQKFDLIIADLQMPKWSGVDFIKHLRQLEKGNDYTTPILFFSGNFTEEAIKIAMEFKVKYFLAKPFSGEKFLAKVEEIMKAEKKLNQQASLKARAKQPNQPAKAAQKKAS